MQLRHLIIKQHCDEAIEHMAKIQATHTLVLILPQTMSLCSCLLTPPCVGLPAIK